MFISDYLNAELALNRIVRLFKDKKKHAPSIGPCFFDCQSITPIFLLNKGHLQMKRKPDQRTMGYSVVTEVIRRP
jgi:hypothetical protein